MFGIYRRHKFARFVIDMDNDISSIVIDGGGFRRFAGMAGEHMMVDGCREPGCIERISHAFWREGNGHIVGQVVFRQTEAYGISLLNGTAADTSDVLYFGDVFEQKTRYNVLIVAVLAVRLRDTAIVEECVAVFHHSDFVNAHRHVNFKFTFGVGINPFAVGFHGCYTIDGEICSLNRISTALINHCTAHFERTIIHEVDGVALRIAVDKADFGRWVELVRAFARIERVGCTVAVVGHGAYSVCTRHVRQGFVAQLIDRRAYVGQRNAGQCAVVLVVVAADIRLVVECFAGDVVERVVGCQITLVAYQVACVVGGYFVAAQGFVPNAYFVDVTFVTFAERNSIGRLVRCCGAIPRGCKTIVYIKVYFAAGLVVHTRQVRELCVGQGFLDTDFGVAYTEIGFAGSDAQIVHVSFVDDVPYSRGRYIIRFYPRLQGYGQTIVGQ